MKSVTLLVFAALLLLPMLVSAAAPIVNEDIYKGDDPRLDRVINYSADGSRIADVLAELSARTGVGMIAGADKDDWIVSDRRLVVHVTNFTLRELMEELSKATSFRWSREGEKDKWTYRLWRDQAAVMEELALRTAYVEQQAAKAREKRQNALSDIVKLASLDSKELAPLKQSDPWRYILAAEPLGKNAAYFLQNHTESREAFLNGTSSTTPISALPPELRQAVRAIMESYHSLASSIGASAHGADLISKFDKLQVTINRRSLASPDVFTQSLVGSITIGVGAEAGSMEVPIFDPESPVARAFGQAMLKLKSGASKEEVASQLQKDLQSAADAGSSLTGPKRDFASDADLRRAVKLFDAPTLAPLTIALKALAQKSGLNFVCEYFQCRPPGYPADEKSVGEHLELIRKLYGVNWEKSGKLIRLRDSEWFIKRTWAVPQVWINYWVDKGKLGEGLEFAELVQIANLRDEQIDNTILNDPVLMRMGAGEASRNRHILRFYGSLDAAQKTQIASQHISASVLKAPQWERLSKAVSESGAAYAVAKQGSQSVKLTKTGADIINYTFTFYPEGSDPPVSFKITTGIAYKTGEEVIMPPNPEVIEVKPEPTPK